MSKLSRRQFVQAAAVALPVTGLGAAHRTQPGALDAALLQALGEAVLPSELGARGARRVVEGFEAWVSGYDPGAELVHGYGTGEIETAPPDPRERWTAQLAALDRAARDTHQASFGSLTPANRARLVQSHLRNAPRGFPSLIADAEHVAAALLAFFYDSPEATDLCYRAQIGKNGCRELTRAPAHPAARQAP